jgi:MscS family membrane protein
MIADAVVDNLGLRQFRRFKTDIGITYDTSPENIDLFVQGIREILSSHSMVKKDSIEVHMNDFGPSSINILLYVFLDVGGWTDELKTRHQLMYAIILLADRLGVEFAFPTQTIHVESLPDKSQKDTDADSKSGKTKMDKSMDQIRQYFNDASSS